MIHDQTIIDMQEETETPIEALFAEGLPLGTTETPIEIFHGKSKGQLKTMAAIAVDNVLNQGNPLNAAEALAGMENFIKEVKADERLKSYTRDEIAKYPKGFVSPSGAKIELAEVGTSYDFSKCEDPILKIIEAELERFKDEYKKRTDMLKTVSPSGLEILVNDELIKIFPPSKSSTSSFKVTLAR